jgi:isoleucyl-tRNA synthetase
LTDWVSADPALLNLDLEASMDMAQTISSLVHSLRKKEKMKVRQPLQRILIPVLNAKSQEQIAHVEVIEVDASNFPGSFFHWRSGLKSAAKDASSEAQNHPVTTA